MEYDTQSYRRHKALECDQSAPCFRVTVFVLLGYITKRIQKISKYLGLGISLWFALAAHPPKRKLTPEPVKQDCRCHREASYGWIPAVTQGLSSTATKSRVYDPPLTLGTQE